MPKPSFFNCWTNIFFLVVALNPLSTFGVSLEFLATWSSFNVVVYFLKASVSISAQFFKTEVYILSSNQSSGNSFLLYTVGHRLLLHSRSRYSTKVSLIAYHFRTLVTHKEIATKRLRKYYTCYHLAVTFIILKCYALVLKIL